MTFIKNRIYWLEHPSHGTFKALCCIASRNQSSLGFVLETPISRQARGGLTISDFIPVINQDGITWDVFTGEQWTVYEEEPATKIPTK